MEGDGYRIFGADGGNRCVGLLATRGRLCTNLSFAQIQGRDAWLMDEDIVYR